MGSEYVPSRPWRPRTLANGSSPLQWPRASLLGWAYCHWTGSVTEQVKTRGEDEATLHTGIPLFPGQLLLAFSQSL